MNADKLINDYVRLDDAQKKEFDRRYAGVILNRVLVRREVKRIKQARSKQSGKQTRPNRE